MSDVPLGSGKKIIQAEDFVALLHKTVAKMRAQKTCSAGDQNPFLMVYHGCSIMGDVGTPLQIVLLLVEHIEKRFLFTKGNKGKKADRLHRVRGEFEASSSPSQEQHYMLIQVAQGLSV